jgi:hypothetical protein
MDEKEGMKAGKGHTVSYIGEMMSLSRLSRAKQDMMLCPSANQWSRRSASFHALCFA